MISENLKQEIIKYYLSQPMTFIFLTRKKEIYDCFKEHYNLN